MAEIDWKGLIWRSAYGNYSYKELLTILKGFGSMEIVACEKPWVYNAILSISLNEEGNRDITLYYLEVVGAKRCGTGREALKELKNIFKGKIFVEDPGKILHSEYSIVESLLFWIKMFREGLIDGLYSDYLELSPGMSEEELQEAEEKVKERLIRLERKSDQSHR